ncbi:aa3-type cytochrome oxidase subunit IV [Tengunoibacter tsumagoiensis]|uniref:cytochrome-c oxidase n=1 Tax=Tengunoibacter tsumagoiensis TaxID=2014871 RepID=A0A402A0Z2_9CHLR|nr:cytochrome c oxidase subunit 4 [Tengunoibacter tsumagoiensis]GCE12681.1 hypothetical protein KTT_25400 [Tengunoibacter tsumagoiensis]
MDSSLHRAGLVLDDQSLDTAHEEAEVAEEEHHIHLPSPSLWPLLLSVAILVTVVGLLFIPDSPWLVVVAAPFILIGILGWALEDPMAAPAEQVIPTLARAGAYSKYQIGQDVLGSDGELLGTVGARFNRYVLVDRGQLVKPYYVPVSVIKDELKNNALCLTVTENDLFNQYADKLPVDLYDNTPEPEVPQITGVPMFANGPLSPAETGHYNYGPNFPGINTDAAGSYRPEEVRPAPQKYIGDRRKTYLDSKRIPSRAVS